MRRMNLFRGVLAVAVTLAVAGAAWAASPTDGADYKGANKCKMCHMKEYKAWSTTVHAKALENLKKADEKTVAEVAAKMKLEAKSATDDACIKCHVTGFKAKTGYPQADSTMNAGLAAVTCEACHGPGSKHIPAAKADKKSLIVTAPAKEVCLGCHVAQMSPKFDYDTWKTKVHAVATEAAK